MQSTHATPQIFISGRIISANNFDAEELFVKFEIIYGTNFKLIEGKTKGETFQAVCREGGEQIIYFDHPIFFNLSSRSIKGWPKFVVEVWANDQHNRNSLIGYGTAFIPFKTGHSLINIRCWRPKESLNVSLSEMLLGNTPEFVDKSAVYSVDEKFGMYSLSTGSVVVETDIIMKDFNLHGFEV
jgi:B9 domain-containing protein 2